MQSMTGWFSRQPRYSRIMGHQHPIGKRFCVIETGECDTAHQGLLKKLKNNSHIEVYHREACDYYLVFCPITSRVGTDISEAENRIPDDKPAILVVMHHTHNPDNVVVDSSRHITKPNIQLTVDCLFYMKHFLDCNQNEIAWHKIKGFLGVTEITSWKDRVFNRRCLFAVSCVIAVVTVITAVYFAMKKT